MRFGGDGRLSFIESTILMMESEMARQEFRDFSGRLAGWVEKSGGRLEGRDYAGRLRGWFDERANETRDFTGRLVNGNGRQQVC